MVAKIATHHTSRALDPNGNEINTTKVEALKSVVRYINGINKRENLAELIKITINCIAGNKVSYTTDPVSNEYIKNVKLLTANRSRVFTQNITTGASHLLYVLSKKYERLTDNHTRVLGPCFAPDGAKDQELQLSGNLGEAKSQLAATRAPISSRSFTSETPSKQRLTADNGEPVDGSAIHFHESSNLLLSTKRYTLGKTSEKKLASKIEKMLGDIRLDDTIKHTANLILCEAATKDYSIAEGESNAVTVVYHGEQIGLFTMESFTDVGREMGWPQGEGVSSSQTQKQLLQEASTNQKLPYEPAKDIQERRRFKQMVPHDAIKAMCFACVASDERRVFDFNQNSRESNVVINQSLHNRKEEAITTQSKQPTLLSAVNNAETITIADIEKLHVQPKVLGEDKNRRVILAAASTTCTLSTTTKFDDDRLLQINTSCRLKADFDQKNQLILLPTGINDRGWLRENHFALIAIYDGEVYVIDSKEQNDAENHVNMAHTKIFLNHQQSTDRTNCGRYMAHYGRTLAKGFSKSAVEKASGFETCVRQSLSLNPNINRLQEEFGKLLAHAK